MRGIDGLKKDSPLGVEPKGEGIQGQSGFSIGSGAQPVQPVVPAESSTPPATNAPKSTQTPASTATGSAVSRARPNVNVAPPPALDATTALAMRRGPTP
jgi:hypothetical protein